MDITLLYISFLLTLVIFFSLMATIIKDRRKKRNKTEPSDVISFELTQEEYHKTLNFMLMHNIIDGKQYNELMVKGSSFLG